MRTSIEWDLSPEAWRQVAARCPGATFFHTPGWYQARAATEGYRLAACHLSFEDGNEALVPLATRRVFKGLATEGLMGLENGYGGLLAPRPLRLDQIEDAYRLLRRRFGTVAIAGNPHAASPHLPATGDRATDATQLLPIRDREAQWRMLSSMRQRHAKKAAKAGFTLEVIERPGLDTLERFYPLYAAHAGAWRYTKWLRDEVYFKELLRHASDDLVLCLAKSGGEIAAFQLLGRWGQSALQLHLSTDARFDPLHVGTFLLVESLSWCYDAGLGTFDVLPSGKLEGVRTFKASFGATSAPFATVRLASAWGRSLEAAWQWGQASRWRLAPGT